MIVKVWGHLPLPFTGATKSDLAKYVTTKPARLWGIFQKTFMDISKFYLPKYDPTKSAKLFELAYRKTCHQLESNLHNL